MIPGKEQTCAVILAGGKSTRFGEDKALLPFNETSFTENIALHLQGFLRLYISEGSEHRNLPFETIPDKFRGIGPLGGILSSLERISSSYAFIVACDMPFAGEHVFDYLAAKAGSHRLTDPDAVVPRTPDGMIHPLCAIYSKKIISAAEANLQNGDYRISSLLDRINTIYVNIEDESLIKALSNINTPEDYRKLCL